MVPSRFRLASTSAAGPRRRARCPRDHAAETSAATSSVVSPPSVCTSSSNLALGELGLDLVEAAPLRSWKVLRTSSASSSSSGQPTSKGTVSRRTSGQAGPPSNQQQRPRPAASGRKVEVADEADHLRVLAVRPEILEQVDQAEPAVLQVAEGAEGDLSRLDESLLSLGRHRASPP